MEKASRHVHGCRLSVLALALAATAGFCSCEKIYEYEGDCAPHWRVKFIYDYNMNFADAFPGLMGVGSVHLYVFDAATHRLVLEKEDVAGPDGFGGDYAMPVEELEPGRYEFVAWCGLDGNDSFRDLEKPGTYTPSAPTWSLSEKALAGTGGDRRLKSLYYGRTDGTEITGEQGVHTVTVPLMKDVNNFTVILQHRSRALNPDDFDVTIADDNGTLLWDNSIPAGTDTVEYAAWDVRQGTAEETIHELGIPTVENNVLVSFLTTSRLVTGRPVQPRLTVAEKSTGRVVFDFPLLPYLLMGYHRAPLDAHNNPRRLEDQEYLDREDTWGMHFILGDDGRGGWYAFELHILDWHVVLNETDLGEYGK